MSTAYKKLRNKYEWVKRVVADPYHPAGLEKSELELAKKPLRYDVLNYLISSLKRTEIYYLEIGVRNPAANFSKIQASHKYSVDPGVEFEENPVDFKLTSDDFFQQLREGKILDRELKFDLIFVDGLHTADQTDRDIENALAFIKEDGFVVLHDCNPPTESHAREDYAFRASPAMDYWSGTTWKAFFKYRKMKDVYSCCIDTDWGVGIISKKIDLGAASTVHNDYFEYAVLDKYRSESLNLLSFDVLKRKIQLSNSDG